MSNIKGKISQVIGPVIDVSFEKGMALPSIFDALEVTKQDGTLNSPLMHTGNLSTLQAAIGHYNTINIAAGNTNLDPRLKPNGIGQKLNMTGTEISALQAFLVTLAGNDVYMEEPLHLNRN